MLFVWVVGMWVKWCDGGVCVKGVNSLHVSVALAELEFVPTLLKLKLFHFPRLLHSP